jgi:hypothetical protein
LENVPGNAHVTFIFANSDAEFDDEALGRQAESDAEIAS